MQVFHGHPEMLVFVDETGADRRNYRRRFGYSLQGRHAVSKKLLVSGRVLAIISMSIDGIVDCIPYIGSVTGDKFKHFIRHTLLPPQLQPFDRVNPQSIVVLGAAITS